MHLARPLTFFLLLSTPLLATDKYYVGPDNGLWSDPNNWSLSLNGTGGVGVPTPSDRAFLKSTQPKTVRFDAVGASPDWIITTNVSLDQSVGNVTYYSTNLFAEAGQFSRWQHSAGDNQANVLSISAANGGLTEYTIGGSAYLRWIDISVGANAVFTQTGGVISGLDDFSVRGGTYAMSGGSSSSDSLTASYGGTINQIGGSVDSGYAGPILGISGTTGTYNLHDGSLHNGGMSEIVGESGDGIFNQYGGFHRVNSDGALYLGWGATTHGTYNLSNGVLTVPNQMRVGYNGTGVFNQTGGESNVGILTTRYLPQSHGTYNLIGGTLNANRITNNDVFAAYPKTNLVLNTFEQASTGQLSLQLDDPDNADYPHLPTSQSASLAGNLTISLASDYTPALGDSFTLITAPNLSGSFSTYTLPPLADGLTWLPSYSPTSFTLSVSVPEPAAAAVFGAGMAVVLFSRKRK